jgi:hypothetical protein
MQLVANTAAELGPRTKTAAVAIPAVDEVATLDKIVITPP